MELFVKEYLAHLKLEKNLSTNTVSSYKIDLNTFVEFIKNKNINDPSRITTENISIFFISVKKQLHLKQSNRENICPKDFPKTTSGFNCKRS